MTVLAIAGWCCSAALVVALARARRRALTRAGHLARVAHELRGPLHAAGLVLHSVRRQTPGGAPTLDALTALQVELDRLALAARDLQAVPARSGAAPARDVRPGSDAVICDVAALVRALAPGWEAQGAAVGRSVTVAVPDGAVLARGHRLRVAQALGNLVGNALEHGAGDVGVRVRGGGSVDSVAIEVTDEGDGLPAALAALIDGPADPSSLHGHGLAITAAVARDAGGRLATAPTAGGARVVLRLPAAPGARRLLAS